MVYYYYYLYFLHGFRFLAFLLPLQFLVSLQLMGLQLILGCSFFLTANLTGIGDIRLQPRIFNMDIGLQLGPTHLSVEIVKFLQLPSSY